MKKIYKNGLFMLAVSALVMSCADYNVTDNFKADPDPSFVEPYKDLKPVKSYIDRDKYTNMSIGATLKVSDFNKQELAHAAAVTNFDNIYFGTTLMSGSIINEKGVMNFLDMMDLLEHAEEIQTEIYGSPIFANANQADGWLATLTAPIEIPVDFVEGKTVNFNEMTKFTGTVEKGSASITKYDNQNTLKINTQANVRIIEDFEVDPLATYTTTFWAKADKDATFNITFSGNKANGTASSDGKWAIKANKWTKVVVEAKSAEDVTSGYLRIENTRTTPLYIQKVQVGYYPDNHRPQTEKELTDTIHYAINAWCDGLMKINEGRIKTFDLIDESIDSKKLLADGYYDLKHSTEKIFWQDILGSDNYAPAVAAQVRAAYQKHGGDPAELRFFISENELDNTKKFESLMYWINVWDQKGAKIDGINAKLNLTYSEDEAKQAKNVTTVNELIDNLAKTGKLIRLSNFDIKYINAEGENVLAGDITQEQRQKLADYYGYIIKTYMSKIPSDKQAGICKGSLVDTSDPVGLWSLEPTTRDWVRNATYKSFCDALSGK